MINNILVSILIPCYNGEKYLDRSIKSALNQTYKNIEIVIGNDGSTDKSLEIIQKYQKQYPSIIRIIDSDNHGLAWQRNNLIENSKGDYFTFLDTDDFLTPKAIEKLTKPIFKNQTEYNLIAGKIWWEGESKNGKRSWRFPFVINTSFHGVKNNNIKFFIRNCATLCHALLFNKTWYKSLNIQFPIVRIFEDTTTIPYIVLKAKSFKAVPSCCYNYVRRNNSLSSFRTFSFEQVDALLWAVQYLLKLFVKENMFFNKKYNKAIRAWFCRVAYLLNQLEINASKSNIDQEKRKLIFLHHKMYLIYLIYKKYHMHFYFWGSWWQIATFFFIHKGYKKILKFFKSHKKG